MVLYLHKIILFSTIQAFPSIYFIAYGANVIIFIGQALYNKSFFTDAISHLSSYVTNSARTRNISIFQPTLNSLIF